MIQNFWNPCILAHFPSSSNPSSRSTFTGAQKFFHLRHPCRGEKYFSDRIQTTKSFTLNRSLLPQSLKKDLIQWQTLSFLPKNTPYPTPPLSEPIFFYKKKPLGVFISFLFLSKPSLYDGRYWQTNLLKCRWSHYYKGINHQAFSFRIVRLILERPFQKVTHIIKFLIRSYKIAIIYICKILKYISTFYHFYFYFIFTK